MLGRASASGIGQDSAQLGVRAPAGPIAERLIAEGRQQGNWVCLQNCHLSVSWLPKLDALLEELRDSADGVNDHQSISFTSKLSAVFCETRCAPCNPVTL